MLEVRRAKGTCPPVDDALTSAILVSSLPLTSERKASWANETIFSETPGKY